MNTGHSRPKDRAIRVAKGTVLTLTLTVLLLALIEGMASLALFMSEFATTGKIADRVHSQHDSGLGWINVPNLNLTDFYGPGKHLRTNSRGFRSDVDFAPEEPPNRIRVVCSGDSFTLGYGVANEEAWCQRLGQIEPVLETVNMGQSGYGFGQAYLLYMRDGVKVAHSVHIFAFITGDFSRMRGDRFMGYPKPLLRVEADELVATGVPVPQPSPFSTWIAPKVPSIRRLRLMQLSRKLLNRTSRSAETMAWLSPDPTSTEVVERILLNLVHAKRDEESVLLLIQIPVQDELAGHGSVEAYRAWRAFMVDAAERIDFEYVDMNEVFGSLTVEERDRLYIQADASRYSGGGGHLTPYGNEVVAQTLDRVLTSKSPLGERMASLSDKTRRQQP